MLFRYTPEYLFYPIAKLPFIASRMLVFLLSNREKKYQNILYIKL